MVCSGAVLFNLIGGQYVGTTSGGTLLTVTQTGFNVWNLNASFGMTSNNYNADGSSTFDPLHLVFIGVLIDCGTIDIAIDGTLGPCLSSSSSSSSGSGPTPRGEMIWDTPGEYTFTPEYDLVAEGQAWGTGGGGNPGVVFTGVGGGGGGAYAEDPAVPMLAGINYNVIIVPGTSTNDENELTAYIQHPGTLAILFGACGGGYYTTDAGSPGGVAGSCVGVTKYSGGAGGAGVNNGIGIDAAGGGGGSSAGPFGAGVAGSPGVDLVGGAGGVGGSGQGSGGNGANFDGAATAGQPPGGGCGGQHMNDPTDSTGGSGKIRIVWY